MSGKPKGTTAALKGQEGKGEAKGSNGRPPSDHGTKQILMKQHAKPVEKGASFETSPQLVKSSLQTIKPTSSVLGDKTESKTKLQLGLIKQLEERYHQFIKGDDEGIKSIVNSLEQPSNANRSTSDFYSIRKRVIELYHSLIITDTEYDKKHDIISHLWKAFYYKLIDLFRKSSILKTKKDLYLNFLNESIAEYKGFYQKLSELFQQEKVLLHRGDLFRYRSLLNSKNPDYSKSEKYYKKAIQLSFNFGNAWNQLAVISTYKTDIFLAIYRYYRSLGCIHRPFKSAKENVILLFKNNVPKMRENPNFDFLTLHGKLFQQEQTIEELDDENYSIMEKIFKVMPKEENHLLKLVIMNLFVDQQALASGGLNHYTKLFNELFFSNLVSSFTQNHSFPLGDLYAAMILYVEYFLQNRTRYLHENEELCHVICLLFNKVNNEEIVPEIDENTFYHDILGYSPLNGNFGTFTTRNENQNIKQPIHVLFERQKVELLNDPLIAVFYNEAYKSFSTQIVENEDEILNDEILDGLDDDLIVDDEDMIDHGDRQVELTQISNNGNQNIWDPTPSMVEQATPKPVGSPLSKLNIMASLNANTIEKPFRTPGANPESPLLGDQLFGAVTPTKPVLSSPIEKSNLMSKLLNVTPIQQPQPVGSSQSVYENIFSMGPWNGNIPSQPSQWNSTPFMGMPQSNYSHGFGVPHQGNTIYNPFGYNYPAYNASQSPMAMNNNIVSPPHSNTSTIGAQDQNVISFPFRDNRKKNDKPSTFNLFD